MKLEKLHTFAAGVRAFRIVPDEENNGSESKTLADKPVERSEAAERLGQELWLQVTESASPK